MKKILMIIILSLFLFSCGEKEEAEEETTSELEGTWKTACYTNSDNSTNIDTLTFVGNVYTRKDQRYSDTACATVYKLEEIIYTYSEGSAVTFMSGNTGRYFKITLGSTYKTTPQSASAVNAFNSSSKCGFSNWELNTAKDCDHDEDDAGSNLYGLYQLVDGDKLYASIAEDSYPNSVNTNDTENTFTKQ